MPIPPKDGDASKNDVPKKSTAVSPPVRVQIPPKGPAPEPKPATTTRNLSADAIAQLMTGLTINGTRQKDGQPFTIELYAAGKAAYSFPRIGAGAGTTFRATGSWRVADGLFCMRFQGFNEGKDSCPVFVYDRDLVSAQRPNGEPIPMTRIIGA